CPCQELNLVFNLRRVACESGTPQGHVLAEEQDATGSNWFALSSFCTSQGSPFTAVRKRRLLVFLNTIGKPSFKWVLVISSFCS
ncbi:MAG TPA: hypothetical protein DCG12_08880, partial [Planctomycetaceae bacterium]|nr:hypothetical protein [Planctomycetaceae bacterium]